MYFLPENFTNISIPGKVPVTEKRNNFTQFYFGESIAFWGYYRSMHEALLIVNEGMVTETW